MTTSYNKKEREEESQNNTTKTKPRELVNWVIQEEDSGPAGLELRRG